MGRSRDIATILSKTEADNTSNLVLLNTTSTVSGVDSAQVQNIGLLSFSTLDSLPVNNLEAGQQAYVTGTNRLYVSNGSGWFNVALINASPTLTIDPTGAITLATDGTPTVITLTATDSDTPSGNITFSVESDGSFSGLGRISQDSSVFTITPKIEDSATTTSSTLTFKASDGINFGSGTTALSLTFAPATVTNSSKTVALITADQTNTGYNNHDYRADVSSNNVSLTLSGTGDAVNTQSYSPYSKYSLFMYEQNGGSGGAGLELDASANWYFGTSDFTIEWWQYWHEDQTGYGTVYDCNYATNTNCTIQTGNGTNAYITYMNGASSTMTESTAGEVGQWYHYALVRNGTGTNNVKMYRNGVVTAQMTYTGNAGNNTAIGIGKALSAASHHLDHSSICDFRIVNGTAVYTSSFTPPTEPLTDIANCVLLLSPKAIIKDYSGEGATLSRSYSNNIYTWTGIGNTSTMAFTPFDKLEYDPDVTGGSYHFIRSQSGQLTGTLPNIGTGDFTIQCWIRLKELNSNSTFFTNSTTSSGPKFQWYLQSSTETISVYGDGSTINSNHKPPINTWNHIALVRDTSAGNMYFYLNGERLWSNAISSNATLDAPIGGSGMQIGSYGTGEFANGWIADMRFSDVAEYSPSNPSLFIVPESPLYGSTPTSGGGSTGNTVMHIATGKDLMIIDKSQTVPHLNHDGGGLTNSSAQAKFGNHSISFTSGRFILSPETRTTGYDGDLYNLYEADAFTVEAWIYTTDNTSWQSIFHTGSGTVSDSTYTAMHVAPTGKLNYYRGANTVVQAGNSSISNNTWHHVALTGDSGTIRLFIDGVLKDTATNVPSYYPEPNYDFHIGDRMSGAGSGSTYFQGYMQDFRITKGLARYTSAFTPPTAALEG